MPVLPLPFFFLPLHLRVSGCALYSCIASTLCAPSITLLAALQPPCGSQDLSLMWEKLIYIVSIYVLHPHCCECVVTQKNHIETVKIVAAGWMIRPQPENPKIKQMQHVLCIANLCQYISIKNFCLYSHNSHLRNTLYLLFSHKSVCSDVNNEAAVHPEVDKMMSSCLCSPCQSPRYINVIFTCCFHVWISILVCKGYICRHMG